MSRTVYNHPDGFTLGFNDNALTATDDDGKAVSLPIGPLGLLELAAEFVAIANDAWNLAAQGGAGISEASSRKRFGANKSVSAKSAKVRTVAEKLADANDAGNLSEQAGGDIGIDCLNNILAAKTQGERVRAIQTAVLDLQRLTHPKRAAGGFSVALVNVLERGLGLCK